MDVLLLDIARHPLERVVLGLAVDLPSKVHVPTGNTHDMQTILASVLRDIVEVNGAQCTAIFIEEHSKACIQEHR